MCNQCLLDPKMDFIFKRIFGNEQEPEILIRFLNAVLEPHSFKKPYDPITSIQFKNTEIPKASIEDKYAVLDVKATTSQGETIDIEIQRDDTSDMLRRSLYYREEFNAREKALKDKNSALATARAISKAEGAHEEKIKLAKNLLDILDDETIGKNLTCQ